MIDMHPADTQDARLAALHDTWHDVQPAHNTPPDTAVAAIRYTPYHAAILRYLRAVVNMPERSQRVFDLTTEVGPRAALALCLLYSLHQSPSRDFVSMFVTCAQPHLQTRLR